MSTTDEKIAAHGQQLSEHERRLNDLDGKIDEVGKAVNDARVEIVQSLAELRGIKEDLRSSSRRTALTVGAILTLANMAVDAGILLYLH